MFPGRSDWGKDWRDEASVRAETRGAALSRAIEGRFNGIGAAVKSSRACSDRFIRNEGHVIIDAAQYNNQSMRAQFCISPRPMVLHVEKYGENKPKVSICIALVPGLKWAMGDIKKKQKWNLDAIVIFSCYWRDQNAQNHRRAYMKTEQKIEHYYTRVRWIQQSMTRTNSEIWKRNAYCKLKTFFFLSFFIEKKKSLKNLSRVYCEDLRIIQSWRIDVMH